MLKSLESGPSFALENHYRQCSPFSTYPEPSFSYVVLRLDEPNLKGCY
jgi:hypothetical protein